MLLLGNFLGVGDVTTSAGVTRWIRVFGVESGVDNGVKSLALGGALAASAPTSASVFDVMDSPFTACCSVSPIEVVVSNDALLGYSDL